MLVGPEKLEFQTKYLFSVTGKYIVVWAGKICLVTYFHCYSPNIRLQKDKFSLWCFQKISQTQMMILSITNPSDIVNNFDNYFASIAETTKRSMKY